MRDALSACSSGSTPFIGIDLNDGLGVPESNSSEPGDDAYIGMVDAEEEHLASTRLRALCRGYGIIVVNAHHAAGPTCHATHGMKKRLD